MFGRETSDHTTQARMIRDAQQQSTTRPRPIHIPPRQPLNETPDASEPSFSYEERSFLAEYDDEEEDAIDAFHRRLGHHSSGRNSNGRGLHHHAQQSQQSGISVGGPGTGTATSLLQSSLDKQPQVGGGSSSNFWRTTSRQHSSGSTMYRSNSNASSRETSEGNAKSSPRTYLNHKGRNGNGMLRRRGAKLRSNAIKHSEQPTIHTTTNNKYEDNDDYDEDHFGNNRGKSKNHKGPKGGGPFGASKKPAAPNNNTSNNSNVNNPKSLLTFPHSNSASSLNSTGSSNNNNGEARMKSKQRDAVRRLKLDAQQQMGEDGGIVDNGYYHEVPTMGGVTKHRDAATSSKMSALEEELSHDNYTTDDSNDNLTENDGSNTFLHSNLGTTALRSQIHHTGTALCNPSTQQQRRSEPLTSPASAALSGYRSIDAKTSVNPGDNNSATRSSLTHHIHNQSTLPQPPPQKQQQVPPQTTPEVLASVPLHVPDNTDNRSTTSTMSDLSNADGSSNANHRHPSGMLHGTPFGSPNSLIGRKQPLHHQTSPLQQQQKQSYRHHPNLSQQQRFPNATTGSPGDAPNAHARSDGIPRNNNNNSHNVPISSTIHFAFDRHSSGRSSGNNADSSNNDRRSSTEKSQLQNKIAMRLDSCETIRFPFKKKLMLNSLHMTVADIPVKDLYGTVLGQSLYKLSLSGNRLSTIPNRLVTCLPVLKSLDISQCELHQLPERWNLPQLRRLNLSHNRLADFPEEGMLEGLLELQELNMFGNKVSMIVVPCNPKLLAKLETMNLGYNDLAQLPVELDRLKSLKVLKVMNNFLEKIPMRICNMDLKSIDVSNNPVIQPPIETCERGIGSMKRYYHCLTMEEQSKPNALDALQSKVARHSRKQPMLKISGGGLKMHFPKPKRRTLTTTGRKQSDDSSISSNSKSKSQKSVSSLSNNDRRVSAPESKTSTIVSAVSEGRATTHESSSLISPKRSQSLQNPTTESLLPLPEPPSPRVSVESAESFMECDENLENDHVTINETLKVIFVGMAMAGKTSMIKRLIEGEHAMIPKRDERTIGVDIYPWDPTIDKRYAHIDNRILLQDEELEELCPNANVKFSVWDFAGQSVYHATHELFFSPRALYVLVWDMGAKNETTKQRVRTSEETKTVGHDAFNLSYDSEDDSSDSDNDDFICEEEARRADRALERDIDEKVQFWVDCIQSSVPGAAILPVATFDDYFDEDEAKRRCDILKQRLERHEERRIQGLKDRLKQYVDRNRANDAPALRLRKLLGSYTRPKIIFGNDGEDSVVRVSGTQYTGFAELTEKINNIATGRNTAKYQYPIFRGHVGARIPRMRLKVLEAVRRMRDPFKVVEWGYFFKELQKDGIMDVENVSDALHFLTNIGELSYFGNVLPDRSQNNRMVRSQRSLDEGTTLTDDDDDDDGDENFTGKKGYTSFCDSTTKPMTSDDGTLSTGEDQNLGGLSQFVFLNPRWLVAAVACILRHDLDREIQETRRSFSLQQHQQRATPTIRSNTFYEANMNCPVITSEDACMLWQAKKFARKAAQRAEEFSAGIQMKPFEFLQLLLVRFRVFIPIDLGIEKAFLGGKEYSRRGSLSTPEVITLQQSNTNDNNGSSVLQSTYFFLPSLLGPGEPTEAWTYKSTDSWKATLCHSILFPDGVPPGLMERITASVLSNLYAMAYKQDTDTAEAWHKAASKTHKSYEGNITVKEILCWRNAFLVKLGMQVHSGGELRESIVEIFTALVDKDSPDCVGSDHMSVGSRRLVTSAKGQEGDGGRKIWMGGYLVVVEAVMEVMEEYGGLEFEKQGFCPECLMKKSVSEAHCWDGGFVHSKAVKGDSMIRCRHGHKVDIRLVSPLFVMDPANNPNSNNNNALSNSNHQSNNTTSMGMETDLAFSIGDVLRSVVVVGLWDGKTRKIVRVGSGFIADKKRGLIVTASHTLMNIWGEKGTPFGENYFGMPQAKVVIGVIPRKRDDSSTGTEAVFRYFAKIIAKDPEIEKGSCHLDACVLCITTRMENDVGGTGETCGDEIEHILLNNPHALKQEKLQHLKITDKCELAEVVAILGYNQGGEGLLGPGVNLNRYVDFAKGYVCKKFASSQSSHQHHDHRFRPREEIVVMCPTIGGHSGGPCVNQQGEVIGILSRADPAENQRCYLVPTYEWRALLKRAKKML